MLSLMEFDPHVTHMCTTVSSNHSIYIDSGELADLEKKGKKNV